MKTSPEKLPAALKRGLPPVCLLSGDEPLQAGEAADAIRAAARAAGFTEREVFFIDRANSGPWDEIFASAQALSLFASRRVLEIRIPGSKPGVQGSAMLQELTSLALMGMNANRGFKTQFVNEDKVHKETPCGGLS